MVLKKHCFIQIPYLFVNVVTFVELVNLVSEVGNDGVVLLPDRGQAGLVVQVGIVQLLLQLEKFRFPLLVDLHCCRRGIAGLLQPPSELLNLPPKKVSGKYRLNLQNGLNSNPNKFENIEEK